MAKLELGLTLRIGMVWCWHTESLLEGHILWRKGFGCDDGHGLKLQSCGCLCGYRSISNCLTTRQAKDVSGTYCCWFGYRYHTSLSHTHTYI
jgi:hypothetical protein